MAERSDSAAQPGRHRKASTPMQVSRSVSQASVRQQIIAPAGRSEAVLQRHPALRVMVIISCALLLSVLQKIDDGSFDMSLFSGNFGGTSTAPTPATAIPAEPTSAPKKTILKTDLNPSKPEEILEPNRVKPKPPLTPPPPPPTAKPKGKHS